MTQDEVSTIIATMRLSETAQRSVTSNDLNAIIATKRLTAWHMRQGVQVGDIVIVENKPMRVAYNATQFRPHDHGEVVLQFSECGEWYLGTNYVDYCGRLSMAMNMTLAETSKTRLQEVWFFHNDEWMQNNVVTMQIPVRVFVARNVRHFPPDAKKLMGPLGRYV